MPDLPFVTLLTDFGDRDPYVGVMKGVMAQICPQLHFIDLTHEIPPQNLAAARFSLANAFPYFPPHTIHLAVVDPGVGSNRRSVAIELENGYLIGPDNGILGGVFSQYPIVTAVELNNPDYWRTASPSHTFHGRDIFSPAAAYLANGVPMGELGTAIDPHTLVDLDLPECEANDSGYLGSVQYCDRFGNLVTNIPGSYVAGKSWHAVIANRHLASHQKYNDVAVGELLALVGSHGWVEIAANQGSAAAQLPQSWGAEVQIILSATG
ncbi:SAM-dependent chlorinase/fluorinase [Geitlerinema sp. PCC 9228]|jgi:hypothetical protein|uniref:SAM hydrolase/SAM-dependent halogenase family protein n=1 Tax=Geitlerinema sp. PCC 9228 TaxID=111611 RepID=UPI0008F9A55B|nr:SAM-dependent chlorinase/fluorinase [Geitlerinema sp. PCC 9228]